MASFSVNYKAQYYQGLYDHYVEGPTTYTSTVDVFGDVTTTASTNVQALGYEVHTNYTVDGTLTFETDEPLKYIYLDLLLCNRVGDVIGVEKYKYMGPFMGSGSFDLHRVFGEGRSSDITYIKVRSVLCDFMDGTSGEAELNLCEPVEVLEMETPKDRNAREEPELWIIILINLFLTPFIGVIYSLYKLIKGYKKVGKCYLKFSAIFLVVYIVLFIMIS